MSIPQTIINFLRILIGLTLIASALLKLLPIEPFEYKFVEVGVANWAIAPYLARFIIGVEVMLGVLLVVNLKPKLTLLLTLLLFLFFTIYLGIDVLMNGNEENCGCFGSYIQFTSLESIVKNIVLLGLTLFVYYHNNTAFTFFQYGFIGLIFIIAFIGPYALYPVNSVEENLNRSLEKVGYQFPFHLIPEFSIPNKKVDLRKGQYLVAFASVNCTHCKKMAYTLYLLNKRRDLPPIYFVFIGTDPLAKDFQKETKAHFPYYIFNEDAFFEIVGESVPILYFLKDGQVVQKFDNKTLTDESLARFLVKTP